MPDEGAAAPQARPERLPVAAVVVNYLAGESLGRCVESLAAERLSEIVVVDNGSRDGSLSPLRRAERQGRALAPASVEVVDAGRNLGYGAAVNLGARSTTAPCILVCNPDLVLEPGAVAALQDRLAGEDDLAIVGPMLKDTDGKVYPSGRAFPGLGDAIGHGFVGLVWRGNPWTRRYRRLGADQHRARPADWVSGACFLVRRSAFESVGGFDEAYFMYVEDVDLCWRLRRAGWGVFYEPAAAVVHEQGRSTSRHPYRMIAAHHGSMWRFAVRSARRRQLPLLPLVAAGLLVRLALALAEHLLRRVQDLFSPTASVMHRARRELQS